MEDDGQLRQFTLLSLVGGVAFVLAQAAGTPFLPELVVFGVLVGVPALAYRAQQSRESQESE